MYNILLLISAILINTNAKNCNILALSGGGAHGVFQVGVLEHLIKSGRQWDVLTGISAGSINAMYLSLFNDNDQINAINNLKNMWFNMTDGDVYKRNWDPIYAQSLYDNSPLRKTIYDNVIKLNSKAKREVIIGATVLNTGEMDIFNKNDLTTPQNITDIIMASTSIPIYFPPIFMNDKYYVDGGLFSDELIKPAINHCLNEGYNNITIDVILCTTNIGNLTNEEIIKKTIFGISYRAYSIISNVFLHHELYTSCNKRDDHYLINIYKPNKSFSGGLLDFNKKYIIDTYLMGLKTKVPFRKKYCC